MDTTGIAVEDTIKDIPFYLNFEQHSPEVIELPLRSIRKGEQVTKTIHALFFIRLNLISATLSSESEKQKPTLSVIILNGCHIDVYYCGVSFLFLRFFTRRQITVSAGRTVLRLNVIP